MSQITTKVNVTFHLLNSDQISINSVHIQISSTLGHAYVEQNNSVKK
jgi:hypothetical protein